MKITIDNRGVEHTFEIPDGYITIDGVGRVGYVFADM